MWEGSRFMLPEHIEALHKYHMEQKKKRKPDFDQQQIEEWNRIIMEAHCNGLLCQITIFGEYEDTELTGKIEKIDHQTGKIKVNNGKESIWIKFTDVTDIKLP